MIAVDAALTEVAQIVLPRSNGPARTRPTVGLKNRMGYDRMKADQRLLVKASGTV